jgi:metal-responsive CopG/Arc/MetJ family transcriptional regulator
MVMPAKIDEERAIRINITMPPSVLHDLDSICSENELTRSGAITMMIRGYSLFRGNKGFMKQLEAVLSDALAPLIKKMKK